MAGAGYKLFQTGDVLTAAQVNTYLNEQTVMVFANAAARTSALTSVLAEGMVSYLQDTNAVEVYNGSAWVGVSGAGDVTEVQAGTGISVASGTGPVPIVTNTMATAIDAEGDLIIGDAADAFQRLAIGSNGNVLTVDTSVDGKIKWAAPAGGGGMTVIASGTLSGASVTISSISGAYKDLRLVVKNWKPATDNETLKAQLNGDTGSSYYASVAMSTNPNNVTFNDTFIYICSFQDNATAQGFSQSTFYEYANTTTWKAYEGITVNNNATTVTNANALYQNGFFNSTAAITEIKLFPNAGNHTSGDYILYGIN